MDKRIAKRVDFDRRCEIIDSTSGEVITSPELLNISTGGVCKTQLSTVFYKVYCNQHVGKELYKKLYQYTKGYV